RLGDSPDALGGELNLLAAARARGEGDEPLALERRERSVERRALEHLFGGEHGERRRRGPALEGDEQRELRRREAGPREVGVVQPGDGARGATEGAGGADRGGG